MPTSEPVRRLVNILLIRIVLKALAFHKAAWIRFSYCQDTRVSTTVWSLLGLFFFRVSCQFSPNFSSFNLEGSTEQTYISNGEDRYNTHPVNVQVWLDNFHENARTHDKDVEPLEKEVV